MLREFFYFNTFLPRTAQTAHAKPTSPRLHRWRDARARNRSLQAFGKHLNDPRWNAEPDWDYATAFSFGLFAQQFQTLEPVRDLDDLNRLQERRGNVRDAIRRLRIYQAVLYICHQVGQYSPDFCSATGWLKRSDITGRLRVAIAAATLSAELGSFAWS